MNTVEKTFVNKKCPIYGELTNITIDFIVGESLELLSSSDYAPKSVISCDCGKTNKCSHVNRSCPILSDIKW